MDNQSVSQNIRIPKATKPPSWDKFKAAVRQVDRDSLLVQAAAATAAIARDEMTEEERNHGLTPWNIADVARTAIAWGAFQRPEADGSTLLRLCNMNVQIADEEVIANPATPEALGRVLARLFFEQFPWQRSIVAEMARTILLFGSAAEHPRSFAPEAMMPGWFESITDGLTLDEYVESVFLIAVQTQQRNGGFSLEWLDGPGFRGLEDVISFDAVRRTFTEHLLTDTTKFKATNREFQDPLPQAQKKYAFNALSDTPFIDGVAEIPIAPWVQAIIAKALPPAVYHLALRALGEGFTRDLGTVFQHYVGRQLALVNGNRQVFPEVPYGSRRASKDSCDWLLDLPELLVLIECKARQPIETLRTGGVDWLDSVKGSIGKGITQLNASNRDMARIIAANPRIDATKARVGLVVTLEPFYLNQNWLMWDQLPKADFPVGVLSVGELESLVLLSTDELTHALRDAADSSQQHQMLLAQAIAAADGRENPLLVSTWDSIGLFGRADLAADRMRSTRPA